MAKCKYCNKEIHWMKEGRKNVPIEGDGAVHKCIEMTSSLKSLKKLERNSLSPEEIKKYEEAINQQRKNQKKK